MSSHAGEEFIYVLSGRVEFHMEPYSPTVLRQGDSVHFDSLMRHGFIALDDEEALILSVSVFDREIAQEAGERSAGEPGGNGEEPEEA